MKPTLGWARARPPGAGALRRGAWYRVVGDNGNGSVVVDLGPRGTAEVPRSQIQIRHHRPPYFSIVVRSPEDPNPVRGTPRDVGDRYAVCPHSHTRVPLNGDEKPYIDCPECGCRFAIAWHEAC